MVTNYSPKLPRNSVNGRMSLNKQYNHPTGRWIEAVMTRASYCGSRFDGLIMRSQGAIVQITQEFSADGEIY